VLDKSVFCKRVKQDELTCLHIHHPKFFAEICLQGAQLTQFIPRGESPLIWLSPSAKYNKGQGLRGGIPICWPWFGSLAKNPEAIQMQATNPSIDYEKKAHGFVRTLDWSLSHYAESAHGVELSMTIGHSADTLKIWPFEFSLTCHFILSSHLEVTLETHNLSEQTMHFSQALHTYFPTNDIYNTRILGAEKQDYIDALDKWAIKKQDNAINIKQEVDRIYFGKADYRILSAQETIRVESNSNSSVIWNPWIDKSKRLSQFSDTDYLSMLCIESANAAQDSVELQAKDTHSLTVKMTRLT
jgi:glucose-6-phosphate 1-epimerase